jgi:hypothetical protein
MGQEPFSFDLVIIRYEKKIVMMKALLSAFFCDYLGVVFVQKLHGSHLTNQFIEQSKVIRILAGVRIGIIPRWIITVGGVLCFGRDCVSVGVLCVCCVLCVVCLGQKLGLTQSIP